MANHETRQNCAYGLAAILLATVVFSVVTGSAQTLSGQPEALKEEGQAAAEPAQRHAALPGGNPLWGIPLSALSATRERPLFTASRRPPAPLPPPKVEAVAPPPPPPAEPEKPPFTLVGTAIGQSHDVALVLDQASKALVRLHIGESAKGWVLRSVELHAMTLEKDSQSATLSMPEPGTNAPPSGMGAQPPRVTDVALMRHRFNPQFNPGPPHVGAP